MVQKSLKYPIWVPVPSKTMLIKTWLPCLTAVRTRRWAVLGTHCINLTLNEYLNEYYYKQLISNDHNWGGNLCLNWWKHKEAWIPHVLSETLNSLVIWKGDYKPIGREPQLHLHHPFCKEAFHKKLSLRRQAGLGNNFCCSHLQSMMGLLPRVPFNKVHFIIL